MIKKEELLQDNGTHTLYDGCEGGETLGIYIFLISTFWAAIMMEKSLGMLFDKPNIPPLQSI